MQYHSLIDKISSGRVKAAESVLLGNKDFDLTYNDGICFKLALGIRSPEMVKTLIKYFEDNQLSKYELGSQDYILLKNQVREAIELAIEDVSLDNKMLISTIAGYTSAFDTKTEDNIFDTIDPEEIKEGLSTIAGYTSAFDTKTKDYILNTIDPEKVKEGRVFTEEFKAVCRHWINTNKYYFKNKKQLYEDLLAKLQTISGVEEYPLPIINTFYEWDKLWEKNKQKDNNSELTEERMRTHAGSGCNSLKGKNEISVDQPTSEDGSAETRKLVAAWLKELEITPRTNRDESTDHHDTTTPVEKLVADLQTLAISTPSVQESGFFANDETPVEVTGAHEAPSCDMFQTG